MIDISLNNRSNFSLGESMLQVDKLVRLSAEAGYRTVGLADTMTISGLPQLFGAAKKCGVKAVMGVGLRIYKDPLAKKDGAATNYSYNLKAFIRNEAGLRQMMNLLSLANDEAHFYYHSRIGLEEVISRLSPENFFLTTGDMFGLMSLPNELTSERHAQQLLDAGFELYGELTPVNSPLFDKVNRRTILLCDKLGLPTMSGYPALYAEPDDADALGVLRTIVSNSKVYDGKPKTPAARDHCPEEPKKLIERLGAMKARLSTLDGIDAGDLIRNSLKGNQAIADGCTYTFEKMAPCMPKMAEDEFGELVALAKAGWAKRFDGEVFGYKPAPDELRHYAERLKFELETLNRMGFSGYFLMVRKIVNWARENGIKTGPGRGSVGGSLVAYLIGITEVDPIRFGLYFERFINPSRVDLPDADLDFASARRLEIIEWLRDEYGDEYVAGISNYTTLQSASALRDTGRVYQLPIFDLDCTKAIPKERGESMPLLEAYESVPAIKKFAEKYEDIFVNAVRLEGAVRSFGQHAAGVIVAGEPIRNRAVVETRTGGPVTNWDKTTVEDWGLIKLDVLGLSTLDVLSHAHDFILERYGVDVDFTRLDLTDEKVLEAFGKGDTTAVFQFESPGMKGLLKSLAERERLTFDDITAATALYRPGPMDSGMLDDYVARKQGRMPVEYDHELIEAATKDTYGVMVYQEQVMQVTRDMAGFTMTEADHVRKAMSKKDHDKLASFAEKFVAGATERGVDPSIAEAVWSKMASFGEYGFNKSHSVAYTLISWMTMWVKVYYPTAFYAATMTVEDKEEKVTSLVADAKLHGVSVRMPDINTSTHRIEILDVGTLLLPFKTIKGVSESTASHILTARSHAGEFSSVAHFEEVLSELGIKGKVNARVRDVMDKVGVFASIQPDALPASDASRLKDQMILVPGYVTEIVKADRPVDAGKTAQDKLIVVLSEMRVCGECSLAGKTHPLPRLGKSPKFMMVFDCPNWKEEQSGKILEGDVGKHVRAALAAAGLSESDGYFTTLVKAAKDGKSLTSDQIKCCSGFIERELEILKPPVIIPMGAASIKHFLPGHKGGTKELVGKVFFDKKLDASIICGFNPATIIYNPEEAKTLAAVAERIAESVS
ncbi:DNA polymerase III subunit alpha [Chromobacterium sp. ASV23]|uniref:DNA polymerase III subunit alpha n=1 Tax=Chromobacterium sp. ASV23 TaxID=2795110 RepID=UPI0018EBC2CE|nr:DNA polymerase III subunit alpha [Chromobacterium sp. ASV23]